jgi:hypothetical protein
MAPYIQQGYETNSLMEHRGSFIFHLYVIFMRDLSSPGVITSTNGNVFRSCASKYNPKCLKIPEREV